MPQDKESAVATASRSRPYLSGNFADALARYRVGFQRKTHTAGVTGATRGHPLDPEAAL